VQTLLLSILIAAMIGISAIPEKLSLKEASPVGVFFIRSFILFVLLSIFALFKGNVREHFQYQAMTYLWIAIPAVLVSCWMLIYFNILQGDLASRVVPIVATAPLFTVLFSVLLLGEPFSLKRLAGALLIVIGVVLVK
jgi:uncharacterized membrane protein